MGLPPPLRPAGTDEADGRPHVLVDGARRPTSALVLSHWPRSGTPAVLARDTSTESALAFLERADGWPGGAEVATCDHLDEDGLAALYACCRPAEAVEVAPALCGLARAGDFDVVEAPEDGRAAWGLRAALDPARTPLAGLRANPSRVVPAGVPEALLDLLGELVRRPDRFEALWAAEEAAYRAGTAALAAGLVRVQERPEAALAVVTCEAGVAAEAGARLGHHGGRRLPVHPAALHGTTDAARILVVGGRRYTYYDRYETWVAYQSRPLPARRDLQLVAARLSTAEGRPGSWQATPPSALVPVLWSDPGTESRLEPAAVAEVLAGHLASAPAAWLPGGAVGVEAADPAGRLSRSGAPRAGTTGRAPSRWRGRRRGRPSA